MIRDLLGWLFFACQAAVTAVILVAVGFAAGWLIETAAVIVLGAVRVVA